MTATPRVRRVLFPVLLSVAAAPAAAQEAPVRALVGALNATEKAGGTPYAQRYASLAPAVDGAFDLQAILQTVVGMGYASLSPADQKALIAVFRAYTICNYVSNFSAGDTVAIVPGSREAAGSVIVRTTVASAGGTPTPIDYVMKQGATGWRAVDVLQDGSISQAAVQRSDFRGLVQRGDGALAGSLRRKIDALSSGAVKP